MRRYPSLHASTCLLLLLSTEGAAAFEAVIDLEDTKLQRCASTPIRVMGLINVGDAALYAKDCQNRQHAPLQLSIRYARAFSAEQLRTASDKLLRSKAWHFIKMANCWAAASPPSQVPHISASGWATSPSVRL